MVFVDARTKSVSSVCPYVFLIAVPCTVSSSFYLSEDRAKKVVRHNRKRAGTYCVYLGELHKVAVAPRNRASVVTTLPRGSHRVIEPVSADRQVTVVTK